MVETFPSIQDNIELAQAEVLEKARIWLKEHQRNWDDPVDRIRAQQALLDAIALMVSREEEAKG